MGESMPGSKPVDGGPRAGTHVCVGNKSVRRQGAIANQMMIRLYRTQCVSVCKRSKSTAAHPSKHHQAIRLNHSMDQSVNISIEQSVGHQIISVRRSIIQSEPSSHSSHQPAKQPTNPTQSSPIQTISQVIDLSINQSINQSMINQSVRRSANPSI